MNMLFSVTLVQHKMSHTPIQILHNIICTKYIFIYIYIYIYHYWGVLVDTTKNVSLVDTTFCPIC